MLYSILSSRIKLTFRNALESQVHFELESLSIEHESVPERYMMHKVLPHFKQPFPTMTFQETLWK